MTGHVHAPERRLTVPVLWGVAFGVVTAVSPIFVWWIPPATVHALSIALVASVYIGFAVADGRPRVIVVEACVAAMFVALAAIAVTESAWLLVIAYAGHGAKDLWQERHQFVANTRWWPPFCCVVDWVAATALAVSIAAGVSFHG